MWPRTKSPSRFASKDWIAVSISFLALVVASGSAYYSVIRQVDEISVVFESTPFFNVSSGPQERLEIIRGLAIVFINAGTRPAAVVSVKMHFNEAASTESLESSLGWCGRGRADQYKEVPLVFEPFVIKEKEIVRKSFTVDAKKKDKVSLPMPSWFKDAQGYWLSMCVSFHIATPSNAYAEMDLDLPNRYGFVGNTNIYPDTDVPIVPYLIWKDTHTIFE